MSMNFQEAWEALSVDEEVVVSNGRTILTSNTEGVVYRSWRSHNFTGLLREKLEGPPRGMRFELPSTDNGSVVGYMILEDTEHTFDSP